MDVNETAPYSRGNGESGAQDLFSEEAFESAKKGSANNASSLPVDDRPDRNQLHSFLYDLSQKYDIHEHTWQNRLAQVFGVDDSSDHAINRESLRRAEHDPTLSAGDKKCLDIAKRNFNTLAQLGRSPLDFLDHAGIATIQFDALPELTADSQKENYVAAAAANARLMTFGVRGSTERGKESLRESYANQYDQKIRPGVQRLLNELSVDPPQELLALANKGDAKAQIKVAYYYFDNETYAPNGELSAYDRWQRKMALPWVDASARQGEPQALWRLGTMIAQDKVCDCPKAFRDLEDYYDKQAAGGDAIAKQMSKMLKDGRRNEVAAALWKKGAEHGDSLSLEMLGQCVKGFDRFGHALSSPIPEESRRKYAAYIRRAAEGGNVDAKVIMGELLELGAGVGQRNDEAAKWYEAAAKAGDRKAQLHMGIINYEGTGVPKNLSESARWFKEASGNFWQLTQILNNDMGRSSPHAVFDNARRTASTLAEPIKSSIMDKINDGRVPYDSNLIEFARKAAGVKPGY
jgi:TPR repeat protein